MRINLLLYIAAFLAVPFCRSMSISAVPERMLLSASMRAASISRGLLVALNINVEDKTVNEVDVSTVNEVIKKHTDTHGSVCFVVRRPG
jgi:phosphohistidine phosphatase SixA